MGDILTGSCLCGASGIEIRKPPKFGIRCFCRDCQHVSGSSHADQVGFGASAVALSGPTKVFRGTSPSGNALSFTFCADCGSPLAKSTSGAPDLVFVYAAALDAPAIVPPLRPVFEERRPAWDQVVQSGIDQR